MKEFFTLLFDSAKGELSELGWIAVCVIGVAGFLIWKKLDSSPSVSLRNVKARNIAGRDIKVGNDVD